MSHDRKEGIIMKVTSYYPQIYAADVDATVKQYCDDLGFTVKHTQDGDAKLVVLQNEHGDRVDIMTLPDGQKEGFAGMRMNVDKLEDGIDYFIVKGWRKITSIETKFSGRYCTMETKEGVKVNLVHHVH